MILGNLNFLNRITAFDMRLHEMNMRFTLSTPSGKPVQILQMNPYTVGALIGRQVLAGQRMTVLHYL